MIQVVGFIFRTLHETSHLNYYLPTKFRIKKTKTERDDQHYLQKSYLLIYFLSISIIFTQFWELVCRIAMFKLLKMLLFVKNNAHRADRCRCHCLLFQTIAIRRHYLFNSSFKFIENISCAQLFSKQFEVIYEGKKASIALDVILNITSGYL